MKKHLRRIPVEGYPPYDDSSMEFALVLQLYDALYYNEGQGIIDEAYVKSAIAVAKSFVLHTDFVERKIPIFFHIEDCIDYEWGAMIRDAGIKPERIRTFQCPPSPIKKFRMSKAFYIMNDPVISQYESYAKWDADLFACCSPERNDKLSTHWLQGHEMGVFYFYEGQITDVIHDRVHWFDKWEGERDTPEENFRRTHEELEKAGSPFKFNPDEAYPNSMAGIMRFSKRLPQQFKDFCFFHEPLIGDEEAMMSLWVKNHSTWIRSLYPQPMAWNYEEMYEQRQKGAYWAHWGCYSDEEEHWEPTFRDDIGIGRPVPVESKKQQGNQHTPAVAVLNLPRRTDRLKAFKREMDKAGYPHQAWLMPGIDKANYVDRKSLVSDAEQEYPDFHRASFSTDSDWEWEVHQWSYLRCLKWISHQAFHVLLMEDDMILGEAWSDVVAKLQQLPPDYNIAMLNYNHDEKFHKPLPLYNENWYIGAKANGTTATVFSARGARMLHDMLASNTDVSAEMLVRRNLIPESYSIVDKYLVVTNPDAGQSDLTTHHNDS